MVGESYTTVSSAVDCLQSQVAVLGKNPSPNPRTSMSLFFCEYVDLVIIKDGNLKTLVINHIGRIERGSNRLLSYVDGERSIFDWVNGDMLSGIVIKDILTKIELGECSCGPHFGLTMGERRVLLAGHASGNGVRGSDGGLGYAGTPVGLRGSLRWCWVRRRR
ncbi:hypothetical protein PIB30_014350 [Stylosanthes scabra]|uniref:PB1-like domain-containing protein n=1 Tax=Stylosanthes scabra TaxID=79078 RepID=A0ABU6S6L3_9FABA|nr:hypothetical protein [Stylosanthes scabra]